MSNPAETDTGTDTSGQQRQAPQPPAWFSDQQQQAIFQNYQKLGFDGHVLHAMNQFAHSGNKGVAAYLSDVFGSLPDPEMTAWIDAQQTQRDMAAQQVTKLAPTENPVGKPPPNSAQAQSQQLAQNQVQQLRQVAAQKPQDAMARLKAQYAQMARQDPVEQEFLRHVVAVKPHTFATPDNTVIPLAQLPHDVQQRLQALAQQRGVQVFGVGKSGWSPALEARMNEIMTKAKKESEANWTNKDRADVASAKAGQES